MKRHCLEWFKAAGIRACDCAERWMRRCKVMKKLFSILSIRIKCKIARFRFRAKDYYGDYIPDIIPDKGGTE